MLKAHLDPNFDGASRKLKFIEKSVAWIAEIIPATDYSLLLDIWCGPGIYAEKFAYLSYQVTGADFSRRSNKYAEHPAHCKKINISYLYQHFLKIYTLSSCFLSSPLEGFFWETSICSFSLKAS